MVGRFPACVLNITVNTALVDVNVHPAKIEVRFANEKPVFDLVYYGVKTAIETGDSVKEATFGGTPAADEVGRAYRRQAVAAPRSTFSAKRKRACKRCCKQRPARTFGRRRRQVCRTVPRPRGRSRCSGGRAKRSADGARAGTCKSN